MTSDAHIGLVLDRSGSMTTMWDEAVSGFNTFKNEQAQAEGTAWMTLNYFDNEAKQKYFAWDCADIEDLSTEDDEIFPRSMTALLDATAQTIKDVEKWLSENSWFKGKTYVVVITDGMENASETKPSTLKKMIKEKESAGWEFIYLAANVDTDATANLYGFDPNKATTYNDQSVGAAIASTSQSVLRSRQGDDLSVKRDVRQ